MLKETTVQAWIENPQVDTFLIDASGVLYNMDGTISGSNTAIRAIQAAGKRVFIASNNSTKSLSEIRDHFLNMGFSIPEDHILSSGLGLRYDPVIRSMIEGKRCYWVGWEHSVDYFQGTQAILTENLNEAEVVVLLSSFNKDNDKIFRPITEHLKNNRETTVICTNPDEYVYSKKGLFKVVGHYVKTIEQEARVRAHWVGKPFSNYNFMVKEILKKRFNIAVGKNTVFFDDNSENVLSMARDLKINGCLVKDTGLSRNKHSLSGTNESTLFESFVGRFSI